MTWDEPDWANEPDWEAIAAERAENTYPPDYSKVRTLYGYGFGDEDAIWGRGL